LHISRSENPWQVALVVVSVVPVVAVTVMDVAVLVEVT
jgi:hypothetical protein